jgi:hypothetical protein
MCSRAHYNIHNFLNRKWCTPAFYGGRERTVVFFILGPFANRIQNKQDFFKEGVIKYGQIECKF